jgi:translation initiation factor 1
MNSELVYSTLHGRICPGCQKPAAHCSCRHDKLLPKTDGVVRVGRETKGRKGKCVTLVTGVPMNSERLLDCARHLKRICGSGGTVKDGVIEIQGDHRDTVVNELARLGFTVRKSGG